MSGSGALYKFTDDVLHRREMNVLAQNYWGQEGMPATGHAYQGPLRGHAYGVSPRVHNSGVAVIITAAAAHRASGLQGALGSATTTLTLCMHVSWRRAIKRIPVIDVLERFIQHGSLSVHTDWLLAVGCSLTSS